MRVVGAPVASGVQPAARRVEARRTPASMADIRAALSRAVQAVTGRAPRGRMVDVLSAQVSLETAHGSAMYNFNFGGIKGASPGGDTASYLTHEVVNGREARLVQGFRAYGSLDEGARDYVMVLQARFPGAFARAAAGDIDGFAHALKQSGYYTAPEEQYSAGLRAAAGLSPGDPAPPAVQPPPGELATSAELSRVLDAIAASATRIANPDPTE